MPPDPKFVVWQRKKGTWSRATQPLPADEARRHCEAANSSLRYDASGDLYRVLPEHQMPS